MKKNEMQVFENSEFGKLEVILIDGKEYFPATDCARMLGYSNPRDAIKRHCKKDGVVKHDGVTQTTNQHGVTTQQVVSINYINEGNLYRLIAHSKLAAAERFECWIFEIVVPSIRKTGGYGRDSAEERFDEMANLAVFAGEFIKQVIPEIVKVVQNHIDATPHDNEAGSLEKAKTRKRMRPPISSISKLDNEIRQEVESLICQSRLTYIEISEYLRNHHNVKISKSAIGRYAAKLFEREQANNDF